MHGLVVWCLLELATQAPVTPPAGTRRAVVVLEHRGAGVTPEVAAAAGKLLHDQVERSLMFAWGGPPALGEDELLVALGCQVMDDACARRALSQLHAPVLLLVDLDNVQGTRVRLRVLHDGIPGPTRDQTLQLRTGGRDDAALQAALKTLLHRGLAGKVVVNSQPPGAAVNVDGVAAGVTPLELDTVSPGPHRVHVSAAGHKDQDLDVVADIAHAQTVHAALVSTGAAPAANPTAATETPAARRPMLGYALLAAGAATAGTGILGVLGGAAGAAVAAGIWRASHDRNNDINRSGLGAAKQVGFNTGVGVASLLLPASAVLFLVAAGLVAGGVLGMVLG